LRDLQAQQIDYTAAVLFPDHACTKCGKGLIGMRQTQLAGNICSTFQQLRRANIWSSRAFNASSCQFCCTLEKHGLL